MQKVDRTTSCTKWTSWRLLAIAYASTVSAVWGYDAVACRGFLAGAVSTFLKLGFLVFVDPSTLITAVSLFLAFVGVGFALAALPVFRERRELLFFLIPVTALLVGIAIAASGEIQLKCSFRT
jgi:hypothetical protein